MLAFQPLSKITKATDCGAILINQTTRDLSMDPNWSLPGDADEVLDLAFGRCVVGKGVFVLYQSSSSPTSRIYFSTYDGSDFNVIPVCPFSTLECEF
jgi:hypothetical protein